MAKVGQSDLISRFKKVDVQALKFITPIEELKELLTPASLEPEFNQPSDIDPNEIYILPQKNRKIQSHPVKGGEHHIQKTSDHHNDQGHEERQKVYRPGPFAIFYKINQGQQDKNAEVWYYKQHKEIIGPVSNYNMDKMVYYKTIQDDTKVAFKTVDKFVKFKKIKAIVEEEESKKNQDS